MERRKAVKNILAGLGLGSVVYGIEWLDEEVETEYNPVYSISDPSPYHGIEFEKYNIESGRFSSEYRNLCKR